MEVANPRSPESCLPTNLGAALQLPPPGQGCLWARAPPPRLQVAGAGDGQGSGWRWRSGSWAVPPWAAPAPPDLWELEAAGAGPPASWQRRLMGDARTLGQVGSLAVRSGEAVSFLPTAPCPGGLSAWAVGRPLSAPGAAGRHGGARPSDAASADSWACLLSSGPALTPQPSVPGRSRPRDRPACLCRGPCCAGSR